MTIKNARLRELQSKAEAAGRRFEEGRSRLYQADGSPLFAEDVLAEQLEELARERNRELLAIEEEARELRTGAAGVLERLQNSSPAGLLTPEELELANARRDLVADDVASLGPEGLIGRLEAVLAEGDRSSMLVYMQAARRRAREGNFGGGEAAGFELTALLERLGQGLVSEERKAELEAAEALGREAGAVEYAAADLRHQGQGGYLPNLAVPGPSGEASREAARLARVR